jgi:pSer/pThr/pTyr-binding forkhead associated (FHA) protein
MASYVSEYVQDYHREGATRMARELVHSVLIMQGVTGTLRESNRSGTVITDLNETVTLSRLVGRVFPLIKNRNSPPGPVLVGRSSESDVPIPDYSISNRHCFFVLNGGQGIQLGDSGSTNGTFVDGVQLQRNQLITLSGGEKLVLGRFQFLFLRPAGFLEHLSKQP